MFSRRGCAGRRRCIQHRSGFRFYQSDIDCVNESVHVDVFTEIRIRDCAARLRFRLGSVDRIDKPIRVCIADQKADRDRNIAGATECIDHIIEFDGESVSVRNVCEIHGALIRVWTGGNSAARSRSRSTIRHIVCETKHN